MIIKQDSKRNSIDLSIYILFVATAILFIWFYRFLPMQDYPDWLFQGFLFSEAIKGQAIADYQIISIPVPNIISTLFIGLFSLFLHPEIAGKLFLTTHVFIFTFGSRYLINSLDPKRDSPISYLPFILIFSYPFFHGNINYIFSLGLFFLGTGYLVRHRHNQKYINIWILIAISFLLYFSHGISYCAWLLFMGVFITCNYEKILFKKFLLALAPSLVMLLIYGVYNLATFDITSGIDLRLATFLQSKLKSAFKYFCIFHSFYPFQDMDNRFMKWFALLNPGFCFGIFMICIYWLRSAFKNVITDVSLFITALIFIFIFCISPLYFVGILNPGQRFLYPALWMIFACVAPLFNSKINPKIGQALKITILVVFIFEAVFLFTYVGAISERMEKVYMELKRNKLGDNFYVIDESSFDYENYLQPDHQAYQLLSLLPYHHPLIRLRYYINIEERTFAPIIPSGMLSYKRGLKSLNSVSSIVNLTDYPNCIVILGNRRGSYFIANLLRRHYSIFLDSTYSIVMKRKNK